MNNSDVVYKRLLNEELYKIKKEIYSLERKNHGIRAITDKTAVEIERLKLRYNQIDEEIKAFENRQELSGIKEKTLDKLDERIDKNYNKQQQVSKNIEELKALKTQLSSTRAKRKVNKEIEHQRALLRKMKNRNVKISNIQRSLMMPKYKKEAKKQKLLNNAQAKVNIAQANYNDNIALQSMLNPDTSFKDNILNVIYDIKGNHYLKKLNYATEVLEQMQKSNSSIVMRGASAAVISKKVADKLRKKMNQEQINRVVTETENVNTTSEVTALAVIK